MHTNHEVCYNTVADNRKDSFGNQIDEYLREEHRHSVRTTSILVTASEIMIT